ncbi:DNA alkylation repair protein [Opitutales bacterium ASA1]|uniref:DNA alkylation repair protein n=1 Tax=Congregicoccus parvus TaxID=3081749 RepID=UPI002B2B5B68|nr:DNA alkylation repair protein [Opitutales bacterium ASA1]
MTRRATPPDVGSPADRAAGIVAELRRQHSPRDVEGQRRFGITPETEHLGLPMATLRAMGKRHRCDHALAQALWAFPVHEARMAAIFVADPKVLTAAEARTWARDFDNWALVDGCCLHLLRKTSFAWTLGKSWRRQRALFVRRAGFVLAATLAVHDKARADADFVEVLRDCERAATDERNFVAKAVNWALRQIGKRSAGLRVDAIATAERILALESRSARWIARDALRELRAGG